MFDGYLIDIDRFFLVGTSWVLHYYSSLILSKLSHKSVNFVSIEISTNSLPELINPMYGKPGVLRIRVICGVRIKS